MRDVSANHTVPTLPSGRSTAVDLTEPSTHVAQVYLGQLGDQHATMVTRRRLHWIASQVVGQRMLDVGTGEGMLPVLLAREGFDVVGIDIDAAPLDRAKSLLANEAEAVRNRVELINTSLFQDMLDPVFDTVILGNVLEYVANVPNFLRMACGHLREEGRLVITTPFGMRSEQGPLQSFFLSDIRHALSAYGRILQLDVADGYIRAILVKSESAANVGEQDIAPLLAQTEQAAFELQSTLWLRLGADRERLRWAEASQEAERERADHAERAQAELQRDAQQRLGLLERQETLIEDLKAELSHAQTRRHALEESVAQLRADLAAMQAERDAERQHRQDAENSLAQQVKKATAASADQRMLAEDLQTERAARIQAETRLSALRAAFLELEAENRRLVAEADETELPPAG